MSNNKKPIEQIYKEICNPSKGEQVIKAKENKKDYIDFKK